MIDALQEFHFPIIESVIISWHKRPYTDMYSVSVFRN